MGRGRGRECYRRDGKNLGSEFRVPGFSVEVWNEIVMDYSPFTLHLLHFSMGNRKFTDFQSVSSGIVHNIIGLTNRNWLSGFFT